MFKIDPALDRNILIGEGNAAEAIIRDDGSIAGHAKSAANLICLGGDGNCCRGLYF